MRNEETMPSEGSTDAIELPPLLPVVITDEDCRRLDARFSVANGYGDSAKQFVGMRDAIATVEQEKADRETQLLDELTKSGRLQGQVKLMGDAIGKIAIALGVTSGDLHLTGPQVLFLAEAVLTTVSHPFREATWISVEEQLPPNREYVEIRGHGYYGDGWRDLQSRRIEGVTHWRASAESAVPEPARAVAMNRTRGESEEDSLPAMEFEVACARAEESNRAIVFLANPGGRQFCALPNGRFILAVLDYPAAARSIALNLKRFCDTDLFYPDMIADAARKAARHIEILEESAYLR